jgi:hypothetical protein
MVIYTTYHMIAHQTKQKMQTCAPNSFSHSRSRPLYSTRNNTSSSLSPHPLLSSARYDLVLVLLCSRHDLLPTGPKKLLQRLLGNARYGRKEGKSSAGVYGCGYCLPVVLHRVVRRWLRVLVMLLRVVVVVVAVVLFVVLFVQVVVQRRCRDAS